MIEGEYYLHENGKLIYKPHGGVQQDSTFVKKVWAANNIGQTPEDFTHWLKECAKLGAKTSEIERLASHNNLSHYVPTWRDKVFGE